MYDQPFLPSHPPFSSPQRLQKSVESSKQVLPKLFLIKSEKNTKILLHSHFMNKRLTKINPSCIKEMSFHKKYFVIYTQKRKYNNKSSQEQHNRQQIISFIRSLSSFYVQGLARTEQKPSYLAT